MEKSLQFKIKENGCETLSFLCETELGLLTIKAEYRVNTKERPTIRTATERKKKGKSHEN